MKRPGLELRAAGADIHVSRSSFPQVITSFQKLLSLHPGVDARLSVLSMGNRWLAGLHPTLHSLPFLPSPLPTPDSLGHCLPPSRSCSGPSGQAGSCLSAPRPPLTFQAAASSLSSAKHIFPSSRKLQDPPHPLISSPSCALTASPLSLYELKRNCTLRQKRRKTTQAQPSFLNQKLLLKNPTWDFPGGTVVKNPPANAGDTGSSPGPGRFHMPWSN